MFALARSTIQGSYLRDLDVAAHHAALSLCVGTSHSRLPAGSWAGLYVATYAQVAPSRLYSCWQACAPWRMRLLVRVHIITIVYMHSACGRSRFYGICVYAHLIPSLRA